MAVHRIATGDYCVEPKPSIHVTGTTFATATVDYFNTGTNLTVALLYTNSGWCSTHGFENSVSVLTWANDTGTSGPADASIFFTVP